MSYPKITISISLKDSEKNHQNDKTDEDQILL